MQYTVEIKNLDKLQAQFEQAPDITARRVIEAGNKSLISLQGTAKQLAPVDQGRLRSSILVSTMKRSGSTMSGSVGTGVQYAAAQETGTGIYGPKKTAITPKNGKFLIFKTKDGHWIRAKSVKGVRARWYMKGSVERNQATIDRYFDQAVDAITNDLSK